MKTSNSLITHSAAVTFMAARLDCTVVSIVSDVVLCHRSDNTFITWRAAIHGGHCAFLSGCYDMTADAAQANLIERAFTFSNSSGFYVVKLTLFLGEFEKQAVHYVQADSPKQAEEAALRNESHNNDAGYEDGQSLLWVDGDFAYQVNSSEEVSALAVNVLGGVL